MRARLFCVLAFIAAGAVPAHADVPSYLRFDGAIGVDPLTAAGGVDAPNTVRGIAPGGRAWVIRRLRATVEADGTIDVKGAGLLFASGEAIATRGPVTAVAATLTCGPADATARRFTSPSAPLDVFGDFRIKGVLSEDGLNAAVLPASCDNAKLLIRSFNTATGTAGAWFAVGIPAPHDED
jgi:hypothetical protein